MLSDCQAAVEAGQERCDCRDFTDVTERKYKC